jgi:hypothetical protein
MDLDSRKRPFKRNLVIHMKTKDEIVNRYFECDKLMGEFHPDTEQWHDVMMERKILGIVLMDHLKFGS